MKELFPWKREKGWPFDESFSSLQKEIGRVFDDFTRGLDVRGRSMLRHFDPKVNVSENDKCIRVTAELPGLDEKDVEVHVNDYSLSLRGEKKFEKEEKDEEHHVIERSYGSFRRVIPLPEGVEREKIKASFKKGVLTVEIPKSAKVQESARKIDVKSE
ncbi:MAG: Hsp20/alpha crystallin family protein [Leptospirales bacterium]|nr:Hsp20/alpha crystallin family protein [Leptospirales bacterium]